MATATRRQNERIASLRTTQSKDGPTAAYPAAIGMISAVVRHPHVYDDPIAEIWDILAALDEVTGDHD